MRYRALTFAILLLLIVAMPFVYTRVIDYIVLLNVYPGQGVSPHLALTLIRVLIVLSYLCVVYVAAVLTEERGLAKNRLRIVTLGMLFTLAIVLVWANGIRNAGEQTRVLGWPFEYRTISGNADLADSTDGPKMLLNTLICLAVVVSVPLTFEICVRSILAYRKP